MKTTSTDLTRGQTCASPAAATAPNGLRVRTAVKAGLNFTKICF